MASNSEDIDLNCHESIGDENSSEPDRSTTPLSMAAVSELVSPTTFAKLSRYEESTPNLGLRKMYWNKPLLGEISVPKFDIEYSLLWNVQSNTNRYIREMFDDQRTLLKTVGTSIIGCKNDDGSDCTMDEASIILDYQEMTELDNNGIPLAIRDIPIQKVMEQSDRVAEIATNRVLKWFDPAYAERRERTKGFYTDDYNCDEDSYTCEKYRLSGDTPPFERTRALARAILKCDEYMLPKYLTGAVNYYTWRALKQHKRDYLPVTSVNMNVLFKMNVRHAMAYHTTCIAGTNELGEKDIRPAMMDITHVPATNMIEIIEMHPFMFFCNTCHFGIVNNFLNQNDPAKDLPSLLAGVNEAWHEYMLATEESLEKSWSVMCYIDQRTIPKPPCEEGCRCHTIDEPDDIDGSIIDA